MNNSASSAAQTKGGAGKTFLSVVFYILIQACALVFSACMSLRTKGGTVLGVYADIMGDGMADFVSGTVCFWCAFSAVILWFGLWIVTTKRIASAIRGLGIACSAAALAVILWELIIMLLTCVFKVQSSFTVCADSLPSQFADGCGDNVIFLISSMMIASVGIFICKLKKLPKKSAAPVSQPAPAPVTVDTPAAQPAPQPVHASPEASRSNITDIDIDVSGKAASKDSGSHSESLAGVCHMCGKRNDPDVSFCGGCGAKLL